MEHSAIGLPHLTGEKWALVDEDILIAQKCGSCNYGGNTVIEIYNFTNTTAQITHVCNWTIASTIDLQGNAAWAAVRAAWGSAQLDVLPRSHAALLTPHDTWAPIIILTGREVEYTTRANFTSAVCDSHVTRGHGAMHWGTNDLALSWKGSSYCFHASNATGRYQLPSLAGCHDTKPVNVTPPWQYKGPHLNAQLQSDTITLGYGNYILDYTFADGKDVITRRV